LKLAKISCLFRNLLQPVEDGNIAASLRLAAIQISAAVINAAAVMIPA
jgi:uncharacterized membrane protein YjfL (UPF0719 family)